MDAHFNNDAVDSATAQALAERLHDGPLQVLAALSLKLTALVKRDSAEGADLEELKELTAGAIGELNKIVYELASGPASDEQPRPTIDLGQRLAKLCQGFKLSSGIECRLQLKPEHTRLPALVSVIVLRTIRELLTNVRRHARARRVQVTSSIGGGGSLIFAVKDDGIGIVTPDLLRPSESCGFGLWSIDQRLREVDGYMELENDDGLCARIVLPAHLLKAE